MPHKIMDNMITNVHIKNKLHAGFSQHMKIQDNIISSNKNIIIAIKSISITKQT
jgi:hypothetical protein